MNLNAKDVLQCGQSFRENWDMTFWTQNVLFMVFLCRWHLILDIQLQYQMLTMMGKFIRTSSLTEYYSHPERCYIFFFMKYILLYFLNKIEALLFFFFFTSAQEDITTEKLSIILFNVFTTSALLRKHYYT